MSSEQYKEIDKLIYKYQAGNETVLFDLFEFYKPLFLASIKRVINKEPKLSSHKEDLLQDCILVLEKLINQYDPNLSYFSYFLSTRIDINLFRYASDAYHPQEDQLEELYETKNLEDPFNRIDNIISIQDAIFKLSDKEKELVEYYFFEELDQKECAEKLSITQGAFSKRLKRILSKLRVILGEDFLLD